MQNQAISNLSQLLRSMQAVLEDGVYVYVSVPHNVDTRSLPHLGLFREHEGITLILPEAIAVAHGFEVLFRCAWISLSVHSDLEAVGFTAAFSSALGAQGISCNVIAAAYHDHVFVPYDKAEQALACLQALSAQSP
ncbi:ACT domain-containing protein [Undibacterium sp. LX40W]|uniref:ACT domain-containing protein n=1 Tax=Undibacterium nitidum TaxID=2762298 RepID=A0A923HT70_9BURK|nr:MULTISPECIES: ACT domain-containing protein [Undibacterium]MBC3882875.1 ACT domain-containing protein [Undibacterium nitidum]MBC3893156.1 ACT domain-containing protein [Undibacterium sp. LX40W]